MLSMMKERDASLTAAVVRTAAGGRTSEVADSGRDVPYGRKGIDGGLCQSVNWWPTCWVALSHRVSRLKCDTKREKTYRHSVTR
jgi:hypothetical protein